ncbi:MAG: ankyrin repeat domain-containing protein [Capsulimonadaceae bacterium]
MEHENVSDHCRVKSAIKARSLRNIIRLLSFNALCSLYVLCVLSTHGDAGSSDVGRFGGVADAATANERLLEAADVGSLPRVRLAIAQGADVNATEENGWTALMLAARDGRYSLARFLLAHGANPHCRSRLYSDTDALELAVWSESIPTTRLLLDYGVDVNERDATGETAIYVASDSNHPPSEVYKMVQFLIRRGAKVDVTAGPGSTPLTATESGVRFDPRVSTIVDLLKRAIQDENRKANKLARSSLLSHEPIQAGNSRTSRPHSAAHPASTSKHSMWPAGVTNMGELEMRVTGDQKLMPRKNTNGRHD